LELPPRLARLLERIGQREASTTGRTRLIALLFLFDTLLIVAVLLSFQGTELNIVREELAMTREVITTKVYVVENTEYFTVTQVIENDTPVPTPTSTTD
jgi:hypothetical protein